MRVMVSRDDVSSSFQLPQTYLIVGLGNLGEKYSKTRHNAGFMAVEAFITSESLEPLKEKSRWQCSVSENVIGDNKVILMQPTTMMNLSGDAVAAVAQFYRVNPEQILAIYDDKDIDFGTIRTRMGGGTAGHNGVADLISHMGEDFARVKVGVKNQLVEHMDTADFVLANFSKDEQDKLADIFDYTNSQIKSHLEETFAQTSKTIDL